MIVLRSKDEIDLLRSANRIVATTLERLIASIKPGMKTSELDAIAEASIIEGGGRPSFKGYRGFPSSLCISINEEVVHGIPGPKAIQSGDIVSLDIGAEFKGYYGDAAVTVAVGDVDETSRALMATARKALYKGIEQAKPGNHLSDISHAIQTAVIESGFSVVTAFVGHGIGTAPHEDPQVPNYGSPGRGPKLKEGMILAIEPMVNAGTGDVQVLEDGWTVVTSDGGRSAHFEHSIAILKNGAEILSELGYNP